MRLDSLDEILRFAIRKEADAAAFYRMAADRSSPGVKKAAKLVTESNLKKLLLFLKQEESMYKEKLERIYDEEILKEF